MQYAALAIGSCVPAEDFIGRVAEVHARAALLSLTVESQVTLLAPELGHQPHGISLDVPADLMFRSVLILDASAAARTGMLRLAGGEVTIDLRGARRWRCGLKGLCVNFNQADVARAWRAACAAVDKDGRSNRFRRISATTLDALDHATRRLDRAAAEQAMCRLIGLGVGRTPEGDDYLVGYFAALWASSDASRRFAAALAPRLVALAVHTEHLSRLFLQAAAGGEVSERIAALAASIAAGGNESDIEHHTAATLAVGHTSGTAAILGLLRGCGACAESRTMLVPPMRH
jgi:hypothetical protein